jgi:pimeloyl-ACP methyl ester carboxylesterase
MRTVTSKDGTTIAFDRFGDGPPVILVGGAFSYRNYKWSVQLAHLLAAEQLMAINYDRRGRGDSGDSAPYAVEREFEDLEAVISDLGGGPVDVWGMSSGGVLALRAAAAGLPIRKLAIYQPPFTVDRSGHVPPPDFGSRLDELTASGQRGSAVMWFMTKGMGVPTPVVWGMRLARPLWSRLKAVAHTLPYDYAVMGDTTAGAPLASELWSSIAAPTLIIDGSKSGPAVAHAADSLAREMPHSRRLTLDRQSHNVKPGKLAPVLREFFAT